MKLTQRSSFMPAFCGALALACASPSTAALEFPLQEATDVVGTTQVIETKHEDTFADLGERYELGYTEMVIANAEIDPWLPGEGSQVLLPTRFILPQVERKGVVINLAEFRLYYFPEHEAKVLTYPVGIGTEQSPSPLMKTFIRTRVENPAWYPPESIRAQYQQEDGITLPLMVPPGPDNPLGPYALVLEDGYLIHGTNKAFGIGLQVSHGCIRMYNHHIEELARHIPNDTPVHIIDMPVKFGFEGDHLLMEVHRPHDPEDMEWLSNVRKLAVNRLSQLEYRYGNLDIDLLKFRRVLKEASGKPEKIGKRTQASS